MSEKFTNPQLKTWWTKRLLSDDYHFSGRLSERQLKLAAEGGFASIVSLFTYPEHNNRIKVYDARFDLPSTSQTEYVLSKCEDCVHFEAILEKDADWKTESTVFKLKEVINSRKKPILFYCQNSYASCFLLLAYYAYVTSHPDGSSAPEVGDKDVFRIGAQLGYNFGADRSLVELIGRLTGNPPLKRTPTPDVSISNWYDLYWIAKPVHKQYYISGQFQTNHVQKLAKFGFRVVVNCRTGKPDPGENRKPEDVALLNISGAADTSGELTKLFPKRISTTRPKSYIGKRAPYNFEFINPLEFGDADGYNPETEKRHINKFLFSARYVQVPFGPNIPFTIDTWRQYLDSMKDHPDLAPILMHCKTGFRAGRLALLAAAHEYHFSSKWVMERAALLGYKLGSDVYNKILEEVLDRNANRSD